MDAILSDGMSKLSERRDSIPTEEEVIDAMIKFLESEGGTTVSRCTAGEQGDDLIVMRDGVVHVVADFFWVPRLDRRAAAAASRDFH